MILAVFKDCFEKSTVPGLLHIATGRSKIIRVLWILFILGACTIFSYHLARLIQKYLKEETNLSLTANQVRFQWPDIYLCNGRPLSYSAFVETNMSLEKEQVMNSTETLNDFLTNSNQNISELLNFTLFWSTIDSAKLFKAFGYTPYENYNSREFVFSPNNRSVFDFSKYVKITHHSRYFSCFYINMSAVENADSYNRIILFHNVDAYHLDTTLNEDAVPSFQGNMLPLMDYITPPATVFGHQGYRIFFQDRNVYPHEGSPYVIASASQSTLVQLDMMQFKGISTGPNPCRTEPKMVKYANRLYARGSYGEYVATQMGCRWKKVLSQLLANGSCPCIPYWMPVQLEDYLQYPICANVTDLVSKHGSTAAVKVMLEQIKCEGLANEMMNNLDVEACKEEEPCVKLVYDATALAARLDLYYAFQTYSKNKTDKEDIYVRGMDTYNKEIGESEPAETETLFKENIVEVILEPMQRFGQLSEQSLAYEFITLISDMGGILGLYLGFCLLTLFEVFNVLHDIIYLSRHKEDSEQTKEEMNDPVSFVTMKSI